MAFHGSAMLRNRHRISKIFHCLKWRPHSLLSSYALFCPPSRPWQTVVCFLALYVPAGLCGHSQILVGKDTFKGMLDPTETVQVSYQVWNGPLSLILSA